MAQTKHTIQRNFPVIGHFRYILEEIRPEIMQYFVETDTEGRRDGTAPVEFSNSIGMPLRDGLAFAKDVLDGFDLKKILY